LSNIFSLGLEATLIFLQIIEELCYLGAHWMSAKVGPQTDPAHVTDRFLQVRV